MEKKPAAKKPAAAKAPADKPAHKKPVAPKKPKAAVHHEPKVKPAAVVEPVAVIEEAAVAPVKAAPKSHHGKSFYAVGRRKTAVAQVLMTEGNGAITINKLPFEKYFQTSDLQQIVRHPLIAVGQDKNFNFKAKVQGGGIHAQAESVRHGLARALIVIDPESRRTLKKLGFLTRDPRVKERKKPGLKRARRAPQFSKR